MKKLLTVFLGVASAACLALGLAACGDGSEAHTHVFDRQLAESEYLKSEADCSNRAVYYKSCECGLRGETTFEYGETKPHSFVREEASAKYLKSQADCSHKAVYYKSCKDCYAVSKDDTFEYGELGSHDYTDEVVKAEYLVSEATCTKKAVYYKSCTVCGEAGTETFETGNTLSHTYDGEIVADKYFKSAATCTKKAVYYKSCTGCGKAGSDTFEYGETEPHTYLQEIAAEKYLKSGADCAHRAVYYKSCTDCGKAGSDTFEYGGFSHNYEGGSCSVCDAPEPTKGLDYRLSVDGSYYSVAGKGTATATEIVIAEFYNDVPVKKIGDNAFSRADITDIVIPYGITHIGQQAFEWCENLTEINLPDTLEILDRYSFYCCKNLTEITFPESVKEIGYCAFSGCDGLTAEVAIPAGVTLIGEDAFYACNGLESFSVSENNSAYVSLDGIIYDKAKTRIISVPGKLQGEIDLPYGLKEIGNKAFYGRKITGITIPNSVTSIGWEAFYGCEELSEIVIPDGVASIGARAFAECLSLIGEIMIPASVVSLDYGVFDNCNGLEKFTVNESNTAYVSIDGIIYDKEKTQFVGIPYGIKGEITIPNGIVSIKDYEFNGKNITAVAFPESLETIGERAFSCTSLAGELKIPDGVTFIGDAAFEGCDGLSGALKLPESLKKIGSGAFNACRGFTGDVTIPDGVTLIGEYAFVSCDGLESFTVGENNKFYASQDGILYNKSKTIIVVIPQSIKGGVTIPDGVTSIDEYTFDGCDGLESFTVGGNNTAYASQDGVLYNKAKTKIVAVPKSIKGEVAIPEGVTSISESAFRGCGGISGLTVPNSVTSIGNGAFFECDAIENLTCPATALSAIPKGSLKRVVITGGEKIADYIFSDYSRILSVTLPDGLVSIGKSAFYNCTGLSEITIPESVTNIGRDAFGECAGLTIYCEAQSKPDGWDNNWSRSNCYVVWDCKNNETAADGNTYVVIGGLKYSLKDGEAAVARQSTSLSGDITIPASIDYKGQTYPVTAIGYEAFGYCVNVTGITVSEGVTSIGEYAFIRCDNLISVSIPNGVTELVGYAFRFCEKLTTVILPETLEKIGEGVFEHCRSLTRITVPESVTEIRYRAFGECYNLVIYCEAEAKPGSWNEEWNPSNRPVVWDCKNNETADDGNVYAEK